jgi:hypothetical protein
MVVVVVLGNTWTNYVIMNSGVVTYFSFVVFDLLDERERETRVVKNLSSSSNNTSCLVVRDHKKSI